MRRSRQSEGRRRRVTEPLRSPRLAVLDLDELRRYRRRLTEEEDKVSYWRRLVHARIDLLEAEARSDGALTVADLVRVLGDTGSGATRTALVKVTPGAPLPELPELEEVWLVEVDPHDAEQVAEALDRLQVAERQLTGYRTALHERIDEATGELITRYRDEPSAALVALRPTRQAPPPTYRGDGPAGRSRPGGGPVGR